MFSITFLRWITLSSILFWLVFYWQGGKKAIIDIRESINSKNSRLDTALLIVIALCSVGIIGIGVLASLGLLPIILSQNLAMTFTGMLFSVLGIMGMFYCRLHLGNFWTAEINLSKSHQIIDTGPYSFVRHPIYAFAILMYIGLGLAFLSQWIMILEGIIVVAYLLKTKDEDNFLENNLSGYREYKLRVRYLLVPGLW